MEQPILVNVVIKMHPGMIAEIDVYRDRQKQLPSGYVFSRGDATRSLIVAGLSINRNSN